MGCALVGMDDAMSCESAFLVIVVRLVSVANQLIIFSFLVYNKFYVVRGNIGIYISRELVRFTFPRSELELALKGIIIGAEGTL